MEEKRASKKNREPRRHTPKLSDFIGRVASRKEAIAAGSPFYSPETLCKNGHIAARYTSNGHCTECAKNFREENKEAASLYNKEWKEKNRARVNELSREYSNSNRTKIRERNRERYKNLTADGREREREKYRAARKKNPEKYRCFFRRYYAAKKANGGTHTDQDIREILVAQGGKCAACRSRVNKYHVDHINPLAKGGSNARRNLQILCPSCNSVKAARDPIEFMQSRGMLL